MVLTAEVQGSKKGGGIYTPHPGAIDLRDVTHAKTQRHHRWRGSRERRVPVLSGVGALLSG